METKKLRQLIYNLNFLVAKLENFDTEELRYSIQQEINKILNELKT